ncbi:MAG: relaxase domain-containing protein [Nitrospira sp.]|nr:relaxase domain-containing protein [Nitrospira sp.]
MSAVVVRLSGSGPEARPASVGATIRYHSGHLGGTTERGPLVGVDGYLSKEGQVKAQFVNPDLWKAIGVTDEEIANGVVPTDVIDKLMHGMDRAGNPLGRRPKTLRRTQEILVTCHAEVSEALQHLPPECGHELILRGAEVAIRQLEECATRKSRGGRDDKERAIPTSARVLAVIYGHAEERTGRPHFHPHTELFAPVLTAEGKWMTLDTREFAKRLHRGGRDEITEAMASVLESYGARMEWKPGLCRDSPGECHGATVTVSEDIVIPAGSIIRPRRAQVITGTIIKACLGASAPTAREVEWIRHATGQEFEGEKLSRGMRRKRLKTLLQAHGLINQAGRIVDQEKLVAALTEMDRLLAHPERLAREGMGKGYAWAIELRLQEVRKAWANIIGPSCKAAHDLDAQEKAAGISYEIDFLNSEALLERIADALIKEGLVKPAGPYTTSTTRRISHGDRYESANCTEPVPTGEISDLTHHIVGGGSGPYLHPAGDVPEDFLDRSSRRRGPSGLRPGISGQTAAIHKSDTGFGHRGAPPWSQVSEGLFGATGGRGRNGDAAGSRGWTIGIQGPWSPFGKRKLGPGTGALEFPEGGEQGRAPIVPGGGKHELGADSESAEVRLDLFGRGEAGVGELLVRSRGGVSRQNFPVTGDLGSPAILARVAPGISVRTTLDMRYGPANQGLSSDRGWTEYSSPGKALGQLEGRWCIPGSEGESALGRPGQLADHRVASGGVEGTGIPGASRPRGSRGSVGWAQKHHGPRRGCGLVGAQPSGSGLMTLWGAHAQAVRMQTRFSLSTPRSEPHPGQIWVSGGRGPSRGRNR